VKENDFKAEEATKRAEKAAADRQRAREQARAAEQLATTQEAIDAARANSRAFALEENYKALSGKCHEIREQAALDESRAVRDDAKEAKVEDKLKEALVAASTPADRAAVAAQLEKLKATRANAQRALKARRGEAALLLKKCRDELLTARMETEKAAIVARVRKEDIKKQRVRRHMQEVVSASSSSSSARVPVPLQQQRRGCALFVHFAVATAAALVAGCRRCDLDDRRSLTHSLSPPAQATKRENLIRLHEQAALKRKEQERQAADAIARLEEQAGAEQRQKAAKQARRAARAQLLAKREDKTKKALVKFAQHARRRDYRAAVRMEVALARLKIKNAAKYVSGSLLLLLLMLLPLVGGGGGLLLAVR
jgi:hypothetical protein